MNTAIWYLNSNNTFVLLSSFGDIETFNPVCQTLERYQIDGVSYWTRLDGLTVGVQTTDNDAFRLIQRVISVFERQYPDWQMRTGFLPIKNFEQVLDDPLKSIQDDLNHTNNVMVDAMEKLLLRGERLDAVQTKSSRLRESSRLFKRKVNGLWSCCSCRLM